MSIWDRLYNYWKGITDSSFVFTRELHRIFTDSGVMLIFFVATLIYPFIYKAMYWNERIENIPVAVVDLSHSSESRDFLHKWSAAPDVKFTHTCASMAEAEELLRNQKVHGIVYFPQDFAQQLADPLGQAHISLYCDMSSFLYMKGIYLSCNMVMLEDLRNIQIDRYEDMGMDKEFAWALVQDAPYTETALFAPTGGYGSFLIPAILVLLLHQTLLLGVGMLAGTAKEEDKEIYRVIGKRRSLGVLRLVIGRALAYFVIYYALAAILLGFIPQLFDLPHIGNIVDILRFNVPYILACVFFAMTISVFVHNRESGLVLLISTSLIFFFLAGVSWPKEAMPGVWRSIAYLLPYTFGVHGFIHINSMGATLEQVQYEYLAMWQQALWYCLIYCAMMYIADKRKEKKSQQQTANSQQLFEERVLESEEVQDAVQTDR